MLKISDRAQPLQQSGIRAATAECARIGGINLAQGICDFPIHASLKEATNRAMQADKTTYSACEGIYPLRELIAKKCREFNHIEIDPQTEVIVTHGSTGAYVTALMTLLNPGDEIILFEPFYGYHKNIAKLVDVNIKTITIDINNNFAIDFNALRNAISAKTRGIVLCTPCNPCGKVFSKQELLTIGKLAKQHDLFIITDEIYEYITYPGSEHISLASLEDFKQRTITISGFSKTYNMTGWRLGYATGPKHIIEKMALLQDLIYVCPNTPLQYAVMTAFEMPAEYYQTMRESYTEKRQLIMQVLHDLNIKFTAPEGAYYIIADLNHLGYHDDQALVRLFLDQAKIATVPGRAFYHDPAFGRGQVRICYAVTDERLVQAVADLQGMRL